jgi:serine/threonine protein kinase
VTGRPKCITSEMAQDYVRGALAAAEADRVEAHVQGCSTCSAALARAAATDHVLGLTAAPTVPPVGDTPPAPGDRRTSADAEATGSYLSPGRTGVPQSLGGYRILDELGRGGMGVVYRAEDRQLGRQVAIKVMSAPLASEPARARFLREARCAAAVEHDNIVPIYHVGEDAGTPYFVMPLLRGQSLAERLRQKAPISIPEVIEIGRQLARGLAAAHARGLIHRDIKPANIWLESVVHGPSSVVKYTDPVGASSLPTDHGPRATDYRVKILDFGLARPKKAPPDGEALTRSGAIMGTPEYISPEQALGEPADFRSDLYSTGVVLYRLATGKPPLAAATAMGHLVAHATAMPRDVRELNPALPAELARTIMQLLEKDPTRRPPSAQALADTLDRLRHATPEAAAVPAVPRANRRWLIGTLAITTIALAGTALVWLGRVPSHRDAIEPANTAVRVKALRVLHFARGEGGVQELR